MTDARETPVIRRGEARGAGSGSPSPAIEGGTAERDRFPIVATGSTSSSHTTGSRESRHERAARHGGYGTLLAAVEHGVPLVIVPFGADQHINARSVERLGIGRVIKGADLTAGRMHEVVRAVLDDPGYRHRIERVRDEGAALPTAAEAVTRIEKLVAAAHVDG